MVSHNESNGADKKPQAEQPERFAGYTKGSLGLYALRVVLTVLILAVAYFCWSGIHVLLLAFAGVLLAVLLATLSGWLNEKTGWPYRRALVVSVLALVLLAGALSWLFASTLIAQITELTQRLPDMIRQVREELDQTPLGRYVIEKAPQAAESIAGSGAVSRVTGVASTAASVLEAVVVILFVGIFGAAEPDAYRRGILALFPLHHRPRIDQALDAVVYNLRWWLMGQVALMVLIGATTTLGLWILGVPWALTLGLITGVMELIPYVGAWLAAIPSALVALQLGPTKLAMTLGLFLLLHILEGYLVAPLIQKRALHLPPALTLVAQVLMGQLLGILGLFVAAPLTVTVVVLLEMLYVEDALGDASVKAPGEEQVPRAGDGKTETAGSVTRR
jgi:predicted PurR-regulated permease PerM